MPMLSQSAEEKSEVEVSGQQRKHSKRPVEKKRQKSNADQPNDGQQLSEQENQHPKRRGGKHDGERKLANTQNHCDMLASRVLTISKRRFYINVKQNERGRFLQIVPRLRMSYKNRLIMSISVAKRVADLLKKVPAIEKTEYPVKLGRIQSLNRVYLVNLLENERGVFLRLIQTFLGPEKPRYVVFIPIEGVEEFQNLLAELTKEFPVLNDEENESANANWSFASVIFDQINTMDEDKQAKLKSLILQQILTLRDGETTLKSVDDADLPEQFQKLLSLVRDDNNKEEQKEASGDC